MNSSGEYIQLAEAKLQEAASNISERDRNVAKAQVYATLAVAAATREAAPVRRP